MLAAWIRLPVSGPVISQIMVCELTSISYMFPDLLQMRKDLTGKRISTGSFHTPPVFLPDPALRGTGETIMAALTTRSRNQTVCWIYPGRSTIC